MGLQKSPRWLMIEKKLWKLFRNKILENLTENTEAVRVPQPGLMAARGRWKIIYLGSLQRKEKWDSWLLSGWPASSVLQWICRPWELPCFRNLWTWQRCQAGPPRVLDASLPSMQKCFVLPIPQPPSSFRLYQPHLENSTNYLPTQAESPPHSAKHAFKIIWHLTSGRSISVLSFQLLAQESIITSLFTETQRPGSSSALTFCIQPDAPWRSEHEHLHFPHLKPARAWAFPTSQEPGLPPTL